MLQIQTIRKLDSDKAVVFYKTNSLPNLITTISSTVRERLLQVKNSTFSNAMIPIDSQLFTVTLDRNCELMARKNFSL